MNREHAWCRWLGFVTLPLGLMVLFIGVSQAALLPVVGAGPILDPAVGADFGVDPGLRSRPLRLSIVAEVLHDTDAGSDQLLAIAPPAPAIPARTSVTVAPTAGSIPPSAPAPAPSPTPPASPTPPSPTPTPTPVPAPGHGRGHGHH